MKKQRLTVSLLSMVLGLSFYPMVVFADDEGGFHPTPEQTGCESSGGTYDTESCTCACAEGKGFNTETLSCEITKSTEKDDSAGSEETKEPEQETQEPTPVEEGKKASISLKDSDPKEKIVETKMEPVEQGTAPVTQGMPTGVVLTNVLGITAITTCGVGLILSKKR